MEINEDQMRKAKATYSELAIPKESATVTCVLAETQRQAGEWRGFTVGRGKEQSFKCAPDGGHCMGKT